MFPNIGDDDWKNKCGISDVGVIRLKSIVKEVQDVKLILCSKKYNGKPCV